MGTVGKGVRWFRRSSLRWAILAVLIVAFLWFVPQLQGEYFSDEVPARERPALVNEYRRTWAQIIGGFGLLLGLYFTWRRIEISQQELEATRDQQVTERFTRAIDQLGASDENGNPRLEIRLGGIYALERIAGDSLAMENYPGRDHGTVMEVLTAYVRENTQRTPSADEGEKQPAQPEAAHPSADIQAILDVLSRAQARASEEYRTRLHLHGAKLRGATLAEADLRESDLHRTLLRRALLRSADLRRANLIDADLRGAYLAEADLRGANLLASDLAEADLTKADLRGANLEQADLTKATLRGAKVANEQLDSVRSLQGAVMPDGSERP